MWISNGMIGMALVVLLQVSTIYGQNACNAVAVATCSPYTCVQTDTVFSCLCPNMQLASSAAACNVISPSTTLSPVVIPNQCASAICPFGSTCIPTNQNPSLYICLCPNNIIANPDCPASPLPNNPCLISNPCTNGGTCVVNQLTLQAVCVCPANTYGPRCSTACRPACDLNWCYNGGRCANAYGQAYCSCPQNYRGRRCELRHDRYNYVYLYRNPSYGK